MYHDIPSTKSEIKSYEVMRIKEFLQHLNLGNSVAEFELGTAEPRKTSSDTRTAREGRVGLCAQKSPIKG